MMSRRQLGNEQVLEEYNANQTTQLADKVSLIKGLSQQIKHDIEASGQLIRDLDRDIGGAGGLLDEALNRLKVVTDNENSRHTLYLILFVVTIFVLLYFFM
jgi:hypothetical protein